MDGIKIQRLRELADFCNEWALIHGVRKYVKDVERLIKIANQNATSCEALSQEIDRLKITKDDYAEKVILIEHLRTQLSETSALLERAKTIICSQILLSPMESHRDRWVEDYERMKGKQ